MTSRKIILYKSKTLSNGEHPIMIRLIKDRKIKYINLGHSCSIKQWNEKEKQVLKSKENYDQINHHIQTKYNEIVSIILKFETDKISYSLESIESKFYASLNSSTVFTYCAESIQRLEKTNKIGSATGLKDLLRSLKKYRNNKDLLFSDITHSFLNRYEEDFLQRGVKENSISVYMRALRALLNKAIVEGLADKSNYPFSTYKISKLNTETRKRAIPREDIRKIYDFIPELNTSFYHTRNFFLFSYFNIGINFKDMALLRWSNITGDRLYYQRAKTGANYDIKIQPESRAILDMYLKPNRTHNDYIFPILNDEVHQSLQSKNDRIKKISKRTNKELKLIAAEVGIDNPKSLTHYVARHSWATTQKMKGTPVSVIGESLGHQDEKTTRIYLKGFENTVLDEANTDLI